MTGYDSSTGPTPEDVQHDMRVTRTHLGAGVRALADRAADYTRAAAEAVEGTFQGVRDTVQGVRRAATDGAMSARRAVTGAAAFAGRAVDVRRHPLAAVAVAVIVGFACGRYLARR